MPFAYIAGTRCRPATPCRGIRGPGERKVLQGNHDMRLNPNIARML